MNQLNAMCMAFAMLMPLGAIGLAQNPAPMHQSTSLSGSNVDHGVPVFPSTWDTDVAVSMTSFASVPLKGRVMRVDTAGSPVWDHLYQAGGAVRFLHVNEANGSLVPGDTAAIEVTGYGISGAMKQGLRVLLNDMGDVVRSEILTGGQGDEVVILHSIQVAEKTLYVGTWKSNSNQVGFACLADASGTIHWVRTLDTPTVASTDWDGINHAFLHGADDLILSGTGNTQVGQQVPVLWRLNAAGTTQWSVMYDVMPGVMTGLDAVPAGAVTDGDVIWQVVNEQRAITAQGNGFTVAQWDFATGAAVAGSQRYVYLDPVQGPVPMRASIVRDAGSDELVIAGFLEVPSCSFDVSCGLTPGEHPPFQMIFDKTPASGTSGVKSWNIYGVNGGGYGYSPDPFKMFSNVDMPRWYHPEMLAELPEGTDGRHLVAFEEAFGSTYLAELIWTHDNGETECPSIDLDVLFSPNGFGDLESPQIANGSMQWVNYPMEKQFLQTILEPCSANQPCDIDPEIAFTVECGVGTFTATNNGSTPVSSLCFEWDFDHGGTSGVIAGSGEASWTWPSTYSAAEVCVTVSCCGDPSTAQTVCVTIPELYAADCPCTECKPSIQSTLIPDFPTTVYDASGLLPRPGGCIVGGSGYYNLRLWSFVPMWFGECWDDRSVEWYVDGVLVETDACGASDGTHYGNTSMGYHDVQVILTDCGNEACVDTISSGFEMKNCVLPAQAAFTMTPLSSGSCAPLQCTYGLTPGMMVPGCMETEWVIDGVAMPASAGSIVECFTWGHHEVTWRVWCEDEPGVVREATESFWCGPVLTPAFELDLSAGMWRLHADDGEVDGVSLMVKGFDHFNELLWTVNAADAGWPGVPIPLAGGMDLARVELTYMQADQILGHFDHTLEWTGNAITSASGGCDSLFTFDAMPAPGPWGASAGNSPGDFAFDVFGWPVTIENMQWLTGTGFNMCQAVPASASWGSGDVMELNNAALRYDFTGSGLNGLSFNYLDMGGQENLLVNGMDVLAGTNEIGTAGYWSSGGITVTISSIPVAGGDAGEVYIAGAIDVLEVAGQEFWMEDLCFGEIPDGNNGGEDSNPGGGDNGIPCDSLYAFDGVPAGGPWGPAYGDAAGDNIYAIFGAPVYLEPLEWGGGNSGFVETYLDAAPVSGWGTGDVMRFNNARHRMDFGASGWANAGIQFEFLDLGGDENFIVNGMSAGIFTDISAANGMVLGGVGVTVVWNPIAGGKSGLVMLNGQVDELIIGGQEFWIDNLCIDVAEPLALEPTVESLENACGLTMSLPGLLPQLTEGTSVSITWIAQDASGETLLSQTALATPLNPEPSITWMGVTEAFTLSFELNWGDVLLPGDWEWDWPGCVIDLPCHHDPSFLSFENGDCNTNFYYTGSTTGGNGDPVITWSVDGAEIGSGDFLNHTWDESGVYVICVTVSDPVDPECVAEWCEVIQVVCDDPIPGCTDPAALNYNPAATVDDGSCIYPSNPNGPTPCDSLCDALVDYESVAGTVWMEPAMTAGALLFTEGGVSAYAHVLEPISDTNGNGGIDFGDAPGNAWVASEASPLAGFGHGHVLRTANANVHFDLTAVPDSVQEVCFEVYDGGGIENLSINGSSMQITSTDLDGDGIMDTPFYGGQETLNGTYLGGVLVMATTTYIYGGSADYPVPVGARTLFRLMGSVENFTIGGQEYWIDDLCIDTEPAAGPATACAEDLNADGTVSISDLLQLLSAYGTNCEL